MAQSQTRTGGQVRPELRAENLAVTVPATGNTQLIELQTLGLSRVAVHVDVTVQALDAFVIQGQAHPGSGFATLYSVAADYTSPAGMLVGASGDLTAQAVGSGWFIMDVAGLFAVRVLASAAADSALVSTFASGS